ncbi:MAG: acyl-CoA dehydrogenase family protein [Acidimicrobiales bacterium]
MTDTAAPPVSIDETLDELRSWLEANWDPDLTVATWWQRLGEAGWAAPTLPVDAFGKGLPRPDAQRVAKEIGRFGALGAPAGLGPMLAAPTIAAHGTAEQIELYVRDIVTGQKAWCQLFSEPGAGSDLAGLQTRAERDGEERIINGQKVWTSGAQVADMGMLLARTDPDVPKHEGITWFAFDMHQPGVAVRPLREMTGRALFNEVFLTDARVPHAAAIGEINRGWAAANTTLQHERTSLGAGGGEGAIAGALVAAGTVSGQLEQRAGDLVSQRPRLDGAAMRRMGGSGQLLAQVARASGQSSNPVVRQEVARLHTLNEVSRFNSLRLKATKAAGRDIPGLANIAKLQMSDIMRRSRDLGLRLVGPYGTLHGYGRPDRKALEAATGNPFLAAITELALAAQATSIYGGTDQVQRNIIGERVLGLPKEPTDDRTMPFRDLPKNG